MDERERVVREVIKVLPELAKNLTRDVDAHSAAAREAAARVGATRVAGRAEMPGTAVSGAQLRALVHLAQYGPQTMSELAEGLQITTASATGLINPLVTMGHVARARDVSDRRVVRIGLTPQAQTLADGMIAERRREVVAALEGMDLAACRSFLQGIERLAGRRR
jgi:DNA-binding MarR family transcriptional regulator